MADCLDDIGYIEGEFRRAEAVKFAANLKSIAAIAIAIDNAAQLISNYRSQRDMADRAMKISEQQQRHMRETYWPRELQFLQEFGTPEDIEAAEVLGRRYGGRMIATVARTFAAEVKALDCNSSRYCTSARSKAMQDLMIVRAQAIANARVLGRITGFAEVQARRDTNDQRRRQAIMLGKGLVEQAASLYANAGQGLASVGKELAGGLNNALTAFGHAQGARDPGRTQEMNNMIQQNGGLNAVTTRMPYSPSDFGSGISSGGMVNVSGTGLDAYAHDPTGSFAGVNADSVAQSGVDAGGVIGLAQMNSSSVWSGMQNERWNEGDVGNRDLARSGSMTYDFVDSDGDSGSITVNMSDFPLIYVDDKNPGDT